LDRAGTPSVTVDLWEHGFTPAPGPPPGGTRGHRPAAALTVRPAAPAPARCSFRCRRCGEMPRRSPAISCSPSPPA